MCRRILGRLNWPREPRGQFVTRRRRSTGPPRVELPSEPSPDCAYASLVHSIDFPPACACVVSRRIGLALAARHLGAFFERRLWRGCGREVVQGGHRNLLPAATEFGHVGIVV